MKGSRAHQVAKAWCRRLFSGSGRCSGWSEDRILQLGCEVLWYPPLSSVNSIFREYSTFSCSEQVFCVLRYPALYRYCLDRFVAALKTERIREYQMPQRLFAGLIPMGLSKVRKATCCGQIQLKGAARLPLQDRVGGGGGLEYQL